MGDAWSTAPGVKPPQSGIDAIIRQAQNATEHAGDGSSEVGLDGSSLRHTDVDDAVGGGSSLSSAALGTSALTAALTLHPCIFVSGAGDASKEALQALLSMAGRCSVRLITDDETGLPTGEASATYGSAAAAEAAIRQFDGSRFDDGVLHVSVSRRATQGSLTKRGKGKGGGGGNRVAFSEAQSDLIASRRLQQAEDEKAAFAEARAALGGGGRGEAELQASAKRAAERSSAALEEAAAKRRKQTAKLPGVLVVAKPAKPAATVGMGMGPPKPPTAPAAPAAPPAAGLLGLADYGSGSDDDDDDGES